MSNHVETNFVRAVTAPTANPDSLGVAVVSPSNAG
jgi:hypothetical protein